MLSLYDNKNIFKYLYLYLVCIYIYIYIYIYISFFLQQYIYKIIYVN